MEFFTTNGKERKLVNRMTNSLKIKNYKIYFTLLFFTVILVFAIQYIFLNNDNIFYQTYNEQLSLTRIDQMLELSKKWQWFGYAIIPVVILLRVFYTTIFLYIGVFFTELKIDFGKLFKVALLADFVFVLAALAKLVILIFFKEVSTLEDLQFQPLSVMELLNSSTVDILFVYPLSLLNVFDLGYFIVMGWLLVSVLNEANPEQPIKFGRSLQIAATSYGSGLLLWVLFVMFLTLNMS